MLDIVAAADGSASGSASEVQGSNAGSGEPVGGGAAAVKVKTPGPTTKNNRKVNKAKPKAKVSTGDGQGEGRTTVPNGQHRGKGTTGSRAAAGGSEAEPVPVPETEPVDRTNTKKKKKGRKVPGVGGPDSDVVKAFSKLNLDDSVPLEADRFEDMHLGEDLLRGILGMGYEKPALCQRKVILPFLHGRDVICQAQSGMGKTAAYCIGILQRIDPKSKLVQALVIVPTRELAEQVKQVFDSLGQYLGGVRTITCIGGTYTTRDLANLDEGAHIVVGTCGRVANLINRRRLNATKINMFVLDEADKMILDLSFRPDLHYIVASLSGDAQILLASATMPSPALDRANEFMNSPMLVLIPNEELTLQGIRQYYLVVDESSQKIDSLAEIFPSMGSKKGMIFCNTRRNAEHIQTALKSKLSKEDDRLIAGMVGSMIQKDRSETMDSFRAGEVNVIVASDLLGRGIDVQQVQVVVNFEMPSRKEEYIHRVGRAGRFGRKGVAITFILNNEGEKQKLEELQEFYRTVIEELPANVGDIFNV